MAFLEALAALASGYAALRLYAFFKTLFFILTPGHDLLRRYAAKSGKTPYAFVTGPTDGVGKEMALMLAAKGFNLVLVGRNEGKLADVKKLCTESKVDVRLVVLDLAAADYETVRTRLAAAVADIDVTVLINNAGMAMATLGVSEFEAQDQAAAAQLISLNVTAFTAVAAAVLPRIVATATRGGVISVSSGSAIFGLGYNAVYAGSKGFNRAFALSLSQEMKTLNVESLALTPLYFASGMVRLRKQFFYETATNVARAAFAQLGRRKEAYGTWRHELLAFLLTAFPTVMSKSMSSSMARARQATLKARKGE